MRAIDVARAVVADKQAHLFRSLDEPGAYEAKPYLAGSKRGWALLDLFTASAIVAVFDGLNETNRVRFGSMDLAVMARIAFKVIK